MNKLLTFTKKKGLTEKQLNIIDYVRAIIGTIHMTLVLYTGSWTFGLF